MYLKLGTKLFFSTVVILTTLFSFNTLTAQCANTDVATLSGDGTPGFANGPGATAQFSSPVGVAVDGSGNVYVADVSNNRIRKITPAGEVTTLAGTGTPGFADGPGATAQFNSPFGVAIDVSGNVYVGDQFNHSIRKITPAGDVSTLAGDGTSGFVDGPGASAQFNSPFGVAVDGSGNVYVADQNNHRIRKIGNCVATSVAVPTMGQWGLMILALIMLIFSFVAIANKKEINQVL